MRPIELVFQAIGPYPNRVSIPFYKLENNGLYLISGVTGSGKTTIFDCICFALFNSTSGSYKENSFLRSHYAKDNTESFVELTFKHKGEIYKVQRTPSFERKKLRGEGTILERGKAQLTLPDSKLVIGVNEVNDYIVDLLGVDLSQFSQIALLAQGEFLKLLNTDSQKRCEIFRNIFKTHNYSLFQLKIKDKLFEHKNDWLDYKKSILQYIFQIETDDEFLNEQINICNENDSFNNLEDFLEKLKEQNMLDERSNATIQEQIKINQKEIDNLNLTIEKLNRQDALNAQKEAILKDLSSEISKLEQTKKELSKVDDLNKQADSLKEQILKIQDDYKKALEITELKKSLELLNADVDERQRLLSQTDTDISNLKYSYFEILNDNLQNIKKEQNSKLDVLRDLQDKHNKLNSDYMASYNSFLSAQAGILAQELKDNTPCPVCGSLEHPNIAKLSDENIDKAFVDNLQKEINILQQTLNEVSIKCANLANSVTSKENEIELFKKRFEIKDTAEYSRVNVFDFELDLAKYEKIKQQYQDELIKTNNEITQCHSKIEILSKDMSESDTDLIILKQAQLVNKTGEILSQIEAIKENFDNQNTIVNTLKSKQELLDKQIESLKDADLKNKDDIESEISEFTRQIEDLNSDLKKAFSRYDLNSKLYLQIKEKYKKFVVLEKDYLTYKTLYDLASGNLKGKTRIDFESYIQGYYLDLVLNEANKRFKIMTNGQFQLLRKKEAASLVSKTGLDIEVMDFHTFRKRSVKSLSGGESFKAALSLALGLSDCVSALSGVIDIDSLFIDEGFGSLDEDSLELAMEVILESGLTNRLTGIISHVKELRNKVQNQIISTKSAQGSTVEIIF